MDQNDHPGYGPGLVYTMQKPAVATGYLFLFSISQIRCGRNFPIVEAQTVNADKVFSFGQDDPDFIFNVRIKDFFDDACSPEVIAVKDDKNGIDLGLFVFRILEGDDHSA